MKNGTKMLIVNYFSHIWCKNSKIRLQRPSKVTMLAPLTYLRFVFSPLSYRFPMFKASNATRIITSSNALQKKKSTQHKWNMSSWLVNHVLYHNATEP